MNPRDLFAAHALNSLGSQHRDLWPPNMGMDPKDIVYVAWGLADAMMEERQKRRKERGPICCPRCAEDLREPEEEA